MLRSPVKQRRAMLASNPIKEQPTGSHLPTMRWNRGPPDAFCYLGPGPTDERRLGPARGFGFAWETTSDQIDSAMPQKTHTERAPYCCLPASLTPPASLNLALSEYTTSGYPAYMYLSRTLQAVL